MYIAVGYTKFVIIKHGNRKYGVTFNEVMIQLQDFAGHHWFQLSSLFITLFQFVDRVRSPRSHVKCQTSSKLYMHTQQAIIQLCTGFLYSALKTRILIIKIEVKYLLKHLYKKTSNCTLNKAI